MPVADRLLEAWRLSSGCRRVVLSAGRAPCAGVVQAVHMRMGLQVDRSRSSSLYCVGSSCAPSRAPCPPHNTSFQEDLLAQALSNVSGFPRIGAQRELKHATEAYWAGSARCEDLAGDRRGAARGQLEAAARRRDRPDPLERLLALRPGARHDRAGRRGAGALRLGRLGRRRPRHLLRDGARPPGRRRRRDRDGDDEVVRHELPLHRPRARARHEVQALLAQAVRRSTRRRRSSGSRPSRC